MMRDILQIFSPNKELIIAKSLVCGKVELELISLMNAANRADCDYFFNGHRIETRDEIRDLLKKSFNSKEGIIFHDYKLNFELKADNFELGSSAIANYTQELARFLNTYEESTIKEFSQCFQMMENKFGWYNFSLAHFLEFWSVAEINNVTNTRIGNRLRQWRDLHPVSNLAS